MIPCQRSLIDATTIENAKIDKEPESPTLDFKREAPQNTADGRTEFLKDVCAFANHHGGDLVYGRGCRFVPG